MSPIWIIVISIAIVYLGTTLGSSFVFFFKKQPGDKLQAISLGIASGIMMAAAFFGLMNPSISQAKETYPDYLVWLPPLGGFLLGGVLLYVIDKIVPHLHKDAETPEGLDAPNMTKDFKFFLAVTIHNLPEGLVTGFSCGLALVALRQGLSSDAMTHAMSALILAIGIAVQDIPEGMAISVPLYIDGMKKHKAFWLGSLSGIVEPIFAIIGMFLASWLSTAMSWFLSFGAGAMLYVIIDDLVPQVHKKGVEHYGLWSFMIGFAFMMLMEMLL
jgi:ZIP family zinc transporter